MTKKTCTLNDKPIELMSEKERNDYFIARTGEPYHDVTKEELEELKKEYGLE